MRFPRVKADGQGFYHCVSRVVEGRFIFQVSGHGSVEAERFIMLMRCLEAFSGVRVLTYVLMSNHFHLMCEPLWVLRRSGSSAISGPGRSIRFLPIPGCARSVSHPR